MDDLTARLKAEALRIGFDKVGIAPAVAPPDYPRYLNWLDQGRVAGMAYMERHRWARAHPENVLQGVRSVVMVAKLHGAPPPRSEDPRKGRIARYAQGPDYHEVMWEKLGKLLDWLLAERPGAKARAVADTAPLLERDYARLAGLGWVGKNTLLIDKKLGSFTVLGALLTDVDLEPDATHASSHCGTCTRCLDACPTDAFAGPYQLDATRCISYWTIEHKGPMPDEAAETLNGWAFGCDVCQDVCPWNRKAPAPRDATPAPFPEADLIGWLTADPVEFARSLKGTALSRARRRGLLRNAALLLGSSSVREAIPALVDRLQDSEPVVRWAAAWALGRIGGPGAIEALHDYRNDPDVSVREAVERALCRLEAARTVRVEGVD
jgi:epoxyqueuosine reductase